MANKLVRPSGRVMSVNKLSSCYRSQFNQIKNGDKLEIVNNKDETLNIAKVIEVKDNEVVFIMVA